MKPFPYAVGIGIDICQISRIGRILDGPRRGRFLCRVLAPEERRREAARLEKGSSSAVFVAGRFAAKEAAMKALSQRRRLGWHDVVIDRYDDGRILARIVGEKVEGGGDEDEGALVSISHDGDYATAVCVAHTG
ncbi:hypothetical protein XA68_10160 [Ophiocordyceps unilateralis]|uniref:4'-phosphopantetheinyl transferase domain-containing protein n=1 Tax=Ophiocordyceps unilateralis TaxID=268505 RepID=A0A2A9PJ22_OPHUN|nr:hypothetical protein XA68_10160 [Ophiocordyceps unilateralis]